MMSNINDHSYGHGLEDGRDAFWRVMAAKRCWHDDWARDENGNLVHPNRNYLRGYIEAYNKEFVRNTGSTVARGLR